MGWIEALGLMVGTTGVLVGLIVAIGVVVAIPIVACRWAVAKIGDWIWR